MDAPAILAFNALLVLCTLPAFFVAKVAGWASCVRPLRPDSFRRRAVIVVTCLGWRLLRVLCWWITPEVEGLAEFQKSLGASGRPAIIVANHTSFLDSILMVPYTPLDRIVRLKMYVSSHLMKIPVLRTLLDVMGFIVVPFTKSDDPESFAVDRPLMEARQQEFEAHVRAGGIAAWFPEGRMHVGDDKLAVGPFRAGGFELAVRVDVEIWCVAFVGNSTCWPRLATLGGRPAKIRAKFSKLCDSSWGALESEGAGRENEKDASALLANLARDSVQASVRDLAAKPGAA